MAGKQRTAKDITIFSYVGNLGCIQFPEKIRKVSGIKRDDRLAVTVLNSNTVLLEKLELPISLKNSELENLRKVAACSCDNPPDSCSQAEVQASMVKVGWSYIELEPDLAIRIGFLPNAPIKLKAESAKIFVSIHENSDDLIDIKRVVCPP
ncbi:MAG TPA: hypothetical protein VK892_02525 [Pyrinomonadaceae bacterium]|nr:hypothetical protein [Pyrinomonadaceae bacterium]